MIYLASPYSHPDPTVRQQRFDAACAATASLLQSGSLAYSPIVFSHPLTRFGLPLDWGFWGRMDRLILRSCHEVAVLTLEGWKSSHGVQAELALARELGKPVRYLDPLRGTTPTFAFNASEVPT